MDSRREYEPHNTGTGFGVSLAGHVAVFALAAAWAYLGVFFRSDDPPPPPVFTLVPTPPLPSSRPPAPVPDQPVPSVKTPKIENLKPIDLPDPPPEPEPAPEPKPEPKPEPRPEPKPDRKAPSVSESDSAKQNTMTMEEFAKKFGRPKAPKPKPVRNPRPVRVDAVKVDGRSFSMSPSSVSPASGAVTQDEMSAYIAYLYATAKQYWVPPAECAGMDLVAKVEISISARGAVTRIRVVRSSGEGAFDRSIESLFRSLTLGAPPRGKAIAVTINFAARD